VIALVDVAVAVIEAQLRAVAPSPVTVVAAPRVLAPRAAGVVIIVVAIDPQPGTTTYGEATVKKTPVEAVHAVHVM